MVDSFAKGKDDDWHRLLVKGKLKVELNEYEDALRIYQELVGRVEKDKSLDEDQREKRRKTKFSTRSAGFISS